MMWNGPPPSQIPQPLQQPYPQPNMAPPIPGSQNRPKLEPIDWNLVAVLNADIIRRTKDYESLQKLVQIFISAKLYPGSSRILAHPLCLRLCQLLQVAFEYVNYCQNELSTSNTKLETENLKLKEKATKYHSKLKKALHVIKVKSQPYDKCPICQKKFKNLSYLDRHISNKHKEVVDSWEVVRGKKPPNDEQKDNIQLILDKIDHLKSTLKREKGTNRKTVENELMATQQELMNAEEEREQQQMKENEEIKRQLFQAADELNSSMTLYKEQLQSLNPTLKKKIKKKQIVNLFDPNISVSEPASEGIDNLDDFTRMQRNYAQEEANPFQKQQPQFRPSVDVEEGPQWNKPKVNPFQKANQYQQITTNQIQPNQQFNQNQFQSNQQFNKNPIQSNQQFNKNDSSNVDYAKNLNNQKPFNMFSNQNTNISIEPNHETVPNNNRNDAQHSLDIPQNAITVAKRFLSSHSSNSEQSSQLRNATPANINRMMSIISQQIQNQIQNPSTSQNTSNDPNYNRVRQELQRQLEIEYPIDGESRRNGGQYNLVHTDDMSNIQEIRQSYKPPPVEVDNTQFDSVSGQLNQKEVLERLFGQIPHNDLLIDGLIEQTNQIQNKDEGKSDLAESNEDDDNISKINHNTESSPLKSPSFNQTPANISPYKNDTSIFADDTQSKAETNQFQSSSLSTPKQPKSSKKQSKSPKSMTTKMMIDDPDTFDSSSKNTTPTKVQVSQNRLTPSTGKSKQITDNTSSVSKSSKKSTSSRIMTDKSKTPNIVHSRNEFDPFNLSSSSKQMKTEDSFEKMPGFSKKKSSNSSNATPMQSQKIQPLSEEDDFAFPEVDTDSFTNGSANNDDLNESGSPRRQFPQKSPSPNKSYQNESSKFANKFDQNKSSINVSNSKIDNSESNSRSRMSVLSSAIRIERNPDNRNKNDFDNIRKSKEEDISPTEENPSFEERVRMADEKFKKEFSFLVGIEQLANKQEAKLLGTMSDEDEKDVELDEFELTGNANGDHSNEDIDMEISDEDDLGFTNPPPRLDSQFNTLDTNQNLNIKKNSNDVKLMLTETSNLTFAEDITMNNKPTQDPNMRKRILFNERDDLFLNKLLAKPSVQNDNEDQFGYVSDDDPDLTDIPRPSDFKNSKTPQLNNKKEGKSPVVNPFTESSSPLPPDPSISESSRSSYLMSNAKSIKQIGEKNKRKKNIDVFQSTNEEPSLMASDEF